MVSHYLAGIGVLTVAALWLNGRYWRSRWQDFPDVEVVEAIKPNPTTAVVVFTGAFNSGKHHTGPVLDLLRSYGDVFVMEYPLRRFSPAKHVDAAYERVMADDRYETIVLYGSSMGGSLALEFARRVTHAREVRRCKVRLILSDVPLSGDFMPSAARLLRYIHPGPVTNMFSSLVTKSMFNILPEEFLTEEYDAAQLGAHIDAMRKFRLSAMRDQIVAIIDQPSYSRNDFRDVQACVLYSGNDGVIDGPRAREEIAVVIPQVYEISVEAGCHTSVVEHAGSYRRALARAFAEFGMWIKA